MHFFFAQFLRDGLREIYGADPAIAAALDGLDEDGILGGVAEGVAQLHEGTADALLEIYEDVGGPEGLTKFLARDYFSGAAQQESQRPKWQILKADADTVALEFAGAEVGLEHTKANERRRRLCRTHRDKDVQVGELAVYHPRNRRGARNLG